jgi:RNA polymerase sigma factor (sigma-70 family)
LIQNDSIPSLQCDTFPAGAYKEKESSGERILLLMLAVLFGGRDNEAAAMPESTADRFGKLYEQFFPRVYNYVNYRIGDKTTAEELTSDVFIKAINKFNTFNPDKAGFSTWIFSIARNTVVDYYRSRGREQKLRNELKIRVETTTTSPEDEVSHTEDKRKLKDCLAKLGTQEKELIALKFGGDMTNREIARITGLSESNVGTIVCRTVRKLRDEFAGWQHGE